jgi:adenine-specific DNA-methyltransferase
MSKTLLNAAPAPELPVVRRPVLRVRELAQAVLLLFGATPLPQHNNPQRHLGRMVVDGHTVLVLADSPNRPTNAMTLQYALALRDQIGGGWDRLVVLGWRFHPAIGAAIAALGDDRLDVQVIPSDLQHRIAKANGHPAPAPDVSFDCRQYLALKHVTRTQFALCAAELLIVGLDNYILLAPHAIELDGRDRGKLNAVLTKKPLSLIEYWAVDPAYDGLRFNPAWHSYCGSAGKSRAAQQIRTQAVLSLPPHAGERRVRVQAVDIFRQQSEVEVTVAAPSTARRSNDCED